jgi:Na+/proline symporter
VRTGVAVIVGLYFAALIGWSLFSFIKDYRGGGGSEESRYVGSRSFGTGALVATLVAAWASNYTLLAAAESGYRYGISGPIWYALGVGLPILLFIWPINIVRRIRDSMPEGVTMVEYVGRRYDAKSRLVALVTVLISSILYIISVILGVGIVLSSLLNISSQMAVAIGGAVLILYTALGGFEATVRSHVYQLAIAGLGVVVALILTARDVGFNQFVSNISQERLNVFDWGPLGMLDFFLALTALTIASPVIWQRLFAARDTRAATRAIAWFPVAWMPFAVGSGIMGMAAFRLLSDIQPSSAATDLVVNLFPTWAAVLFLLGGLALVFSSGDAAINNVASIVQVDILDNYLGVSLTRRQNLYVSFALQIGLGIIGVVGALSFQSILGLLVINSAINIALILPLYLGLVWARASSSGAFWSILLALGIGGTLIAAQQGPLANLVALLVSVTVFVGLSYLSSYRTRAAEEAEEGATERDGGWLPRVVVGTVAVAALYGVLYALASAFGGVVLRMPEALIYPLYVYAIVGCAAMVLVLPIFALRQNK